MYASLNLLIVAPSRQTLAPVMADLEGRQGLELTPNVLEPGQSLLLEYMRPMPDALILVVDEEWRQGVWEFIERLSTPHPPLFIVSQIRDVEMMRLAMRFGVRDVFVPPLQVDECVSSIYKVVQEERARAGEAGSHLVSFMNTKGGSGASLIAANVALAMAKEPRSSRPILLVDFDFQFGGLPTYLNLVARDGLIKAMEFVDTLDATALQGYVLRHPSGLHLLATAMDEIIIPEDISAERTEKLLSALNGVYDDILIDLPHRIDQATATILSRSDIIALTAQQSVAHLHYTRRLLYLLRDRLSINQDRIVILLNRFDAKAEVTREDFVDVFPNIPIHTLPGDHVRADESINLGIPICESAANSPLGKSLLKLAKELAKGYAGHDVAQGTQVGTRGSTPPAKKGGLFGWLKRE